MGQQCVQFIAEDRLRRTKPDGDIVDSWYEHQVRVFKAAVS